MDGLTRFTAVDVSWSQTASFGLGLVAIYKGSPELILQALVSKITAKRNTIIPDTKARIKFAKVRYMMRG